jgi:hypothetical protein
MHQKFLFDSGESANILFSEMIEKNQVFSLSRLGWSEFGWMNHYIEGGINCPVKGTTLRNLVSSQGVYGNCAHEFFEEYTKSISTSDFHVFWIEPNGTHVILNEQVNVFKNFSNSSIKVGHEVLSSYLHENFWTKKLEGKKVLVIYPFVKTIELQYQKKEGIWKDTHSGKLPNFELITYKPVWTLNGSHPHKSWIDSLNYMKDEISKIDFDVALVGCSHYGTPLISFIKTILNKTAIYFGGELQILFGIKGRRWDNMPHVSKFYNENWTRSIDEIPTGHTIMDGGCYW